MLSGSLYLIVFSFSSQHNAAVLHNTCEVVLPQKRLSASLQKVKKGSGEEWEK